VGLISHPYKKTMKVQFIKSPIGKFGLAYAEGMQADLQKEQAVLLIEAGYAIQLEIVEQAIQKEVKEKRVK
jgi:hypothetical protein